MTMAQSIMDGMTSREACYEAIQRVVFPADHNLKLEIWFDPIKCKFFADACPYVGSGDSLYSAMVDLEDQLLEGADNAERQRR